MRLLFITAMVVTAAIALIACPYHRPVPGPQTSSSAALSLSGAAHAQLAQPRQSAPPPAEIIWFQGTLDEAFARRPCPCDEPRRRQ
jgi:hypothetical protein